MSELRCLNCPPGRGSHEGGICGDAADNAGAAGYTGEVVMGQVGKIGVGMPTVGEERSQKRISRSEPP